MTAIDIFTYSGQQVRTVLVDGEGWFVAADVARVLGYSATEAMTRSLDDDEKGMRTLHTLGGAQSLTVINEPGLYSAIIRSTIPAAKEFKRWVTHEVLPQIRRTGQFGSALPSNLADALEFAAIEVRKSEALEAQAVIDAPKVEAFDRLMDADGYYDMAQVGKMAGIGRTTLYSRLRDAAVIQRGGTTPYQQYMHHFVLTAGTWQDSAGQIHPTSTTRLRPSGLPFILKKLGMTVTVPPL